MEVDLSTLCSAVSEYEFSSGFGVGAAFVVAADLVWSMFKELRA